MYPGALPKQAHLSWLPVYPGESPPPHAVDAGSRVYVIRCRHEQDVIPGKWPYDLGGIAHIPYHGKEIETDHKPLEWIKSAKDPRGRLARWALRLQEYDFTIHRVAGKGNCVPDLLSRTQHLDEVHKDVVGVNSIELESDPEKLQAAREMNTTIRTVIDRLLSGGQPPEDEVNPELKASRMHWSDLRLNSAGILMRQLREGINVPVIPAELRATIVKECHQLAHTGCHRTYEMLKQRAYWPGMKNDGIPMNCLSLSVLVILGEAISETVGTLMCSNSEQFHWSPGSIVLPPQTFDVIPWSVDLEPSTETEVCNCISDLKGERASGLDGLVSVNFEEDRETLVKALTQLFRIV
ncbi:uncharacterized protein DEA37_0007879 [Paragonimus westermani]|uniref:Integrase zinc-binding domain-containing protein n=1 Tax=Paragonimus westermani TaxID=34504 RepID=A0A5J4NLY3_9TREM|nr:uncharacterized protein DEA37_0007879 [Paragonimus westermani]